MNKRKLHHTLVQLRKVSYFVMLGGFIFFSVIALVSLRSNNQRMIGLRDKVFTADKEGGDVEKALSDLRTYVFKHMNTNLASGQNAVKPPIQLKYQYERLVAAEKAAFDAANARVVADAESTCVRQYPNQTFSQLRLDCARAYAAAHPVTQKVITDDLYKFDFASPFWSPDLAGWSLVGAGVSLLLFVLRFLSELAIKKELKARS